MSKQGYELSLTCSLSGDTVFLHCEEQHFHEVLDMFVRACKVVTFHEETIKSCMQEYLDESV